jgi:hypothetical protein
VNCETGYLKWPQRAETQKCSHIIWSHGDTLCSSRNYFLRCYWCLTFEFRFDDRADFLLMVELIDQVVDNGLLSDRPRAIIVISGVNRFLYCAVQDWGARLGQRRPNKRVSLSLQRQHRHSAIALLDPAVMSCCIYWWIVYILKSCWETFEMSHGVLVCNSLCFLCFFSLNKRCKYVPVF